MISALSFSRDRRVREVSTGSHFGGKNGNDTHALSIDAEGSQNSACLTMCSGETIDAEGSQNSACLTMCSGETEVSWDGKDSMASHGHVLPVRRSTSEDKIATRAGGLFSASKAFNMSLSRLFTKQVFSTKRQSVPDYHSLQYKSKSHPPTSSSGEIRQHETEQDTNFQHVPSHIEVYLASIEKHSRGWAEVPCCDDAPDPSDRVAESFTSHPLSFDRARSFSHSMKDIGSTNVNFSHQQQHTGESDTCHEDNVGQKNPYHTFPDTNVGGFSEYSTSSVTQSTISTESAGSLSVRRWKKKLSINVTNLLDTVTTPILSPSSGRRSEPPSLAKHAERLSGREEEENEVHFSVYRVVVVSKISDGRKMYKYRTTRKNEVVLRLTLKSICVMDREANNVRHEYPYNQLVAVILKDTGTEQNMRIITFEFGQAEGTEKRVISFASFQCDEIVSNLTNLVRRGSYAGLV